MHCQWDITVILLSLGIHFSFLPQLRAITSHTACIRSSLFMKGLFELNQEIILAESFSSIESVMIPSLMQFPPVLVSLSGMQVRSMATMAGALHDEGSLLHVCRLALHAFIRIFSAHVRISLLGLWLSGDAAKGRGSSIR